MGFRNLGRITTGTAENKSGKFAASGKKCVCSLLPFSFLICSDSFSLILSFLIYKQAWSLKNPSVAITIRAAPFKKNRERFEKEQRQTKSQSNPNDQSERMKISHRANENSEQINLNGIKSGKSGTHHKAEVVLNVASDWLRGGTILGPITECREEKSTKSRVSFRHSVYKLLHKEAALV